MAKLLIITGPTATGKTALAIRLAKKFNGEILSADSRQVYNYLDIGTGKDKEEYTKGGIPAWGLDLVNPDYNFNVSDYIRYARSVIADIQNREKLPIVVGGTGLYLRAILTPPETLNIPQNAKLRVKLLNWSVARLQHKLQKLDSGKWNRMNESDRSNPRRLVRAIEVALSSPKVGLNPAIERYDSLILGLTAQKAILDQRIDARVDKRIEQGIAVEREAILKMGYSRDLPSMSALGYQQISPEIWKQQEHAYARRQLTYQKKLPGIIWFDITDPSYSQKVIEKVKTWYSDSDDHQSNKA